MTKEVSVTVDPRPLDNQGNPQDITQNPPPYSSIVGAYQQQQPGYLPPYQGPQHQQPPILQPGQVIITSPIVVQSGTVLSTGALPFVTVCPNCQKQITTRVDSQTSMIQHFWAMGLCIIG